VENFDLLREISIIKHSSTQQGVYEIWENMNRRYLKGEIRSYDLEEIKDAVFYRLGELEAKKIASQNVTIGVGSIVMENC
jgi:hypothetical protein